MADITDHFLDITADVCPITFVKAKLLIEKMKSAHSPMEIIEYLHSGIPSSAITQLSETLDMSKEQLCRYTGLKTRTLSRRKILNVDVAGRLMRVVSVYLTALKVLEDERMALKWLSSPQVAFEGKLPLELLDTDFGAREVEKLLMKLEHGIYI